MKRLLFLGALLALLPRPAHALRVYDNGRTRTVRPAALRRMEQAVTLGGQQTWRTSRVAVANTATWNLLGGARRWRLGSDSVTRRTLLSARGPGQAVYQVTRDEVGVATVLLTVSHRAYSIHLLRPLTHVWYVTGVQRVR